MKRSKEEVAQLWKKYKKGHDRSVKGILAEQYLPVVNHHAWKLEHRTPYNVTFEDLVSAGVVGLLEAIDRFELKRGVPFQAYCGGRIYGAMLDYLRSIDHVPRLARSRSNRIQEAYCKLERKYNRAPSDMELAKALRISVDHLDRLYGELRGALPLELPRRKLAKDDQQLGLEYVEDRKAESPVVLSLRRDLVQFLQAKLSLREGSILMKYHVDDLTFKEIAAILGLSESRVCQIHVRALTRLQAQLKRRAASVA